MTDHLNCKIQLVLNVYSLVKQNRIKSVLLNILSFISVLIFYMRYTTVAPWVASALALINSVTLGWLAFCQHSNLVYLNQALVDLCERLPHPGNEEDLHQYELIFSDDAFLQKQEHFLQVACCQVAPASQLPATKLECQSRLKNGYNEDF